MFSGWGPTLHRPHSLGETPTPACSLPVGPGPGATVQSSRLAPPLSAEMLFGKDGLSGPPAQHQQARPAHWLRSSSKRVPRPQAPSGDPRASASGLPVPSQEQSSGLAVAMAMHPQGTTSARSSGPKTSALSLSAETFALEHGPRPPSGPRHRPGPAAPPRTSHRSCPAHQTQSHRAQDTLPAPPRAMTSRAKTELGQCPERRPKALQVPTPPPLHPQRNWTLRGSQRRGLLGAQWPQGPGRPATHLPLHAGLPVGQRPPHSSCGPGPGRAGARRAAPCQDEDCCGPKRSRIPTGDKTSPLRALCGHLGHGHAPQGHFSDQNTRPLLLRAWLGKAGRPPVLHLSDRFLEGWR